MPTSPRDQEEMPGYDFDAELKRERERMNIDLPKHAADKVKRALDDVHQVAADPGEMLRIALMGAGICIGQASGVLHGMMERDGVKVTERQVKEQIMELLGTMVTEGVDATWKKLNGDQ